MIARNNESKDQSEIKEIISTDNNTNIISKSLATIQPIYKIVAKVKWISNII